MLPRDRYTIQTEAGMIVRAGTVVTMDGPSIENGAVAISGERIAAVGTLDEVRKRFSGDIVDLGERVLLPGLINAHCHLDYTAFRGRIASQLSFTDWIRCINAEKGRLQPLDYAVSINAGIAEAIKFGTTSIANLEAFPELVSQISNPIRIWWLAELIDVRSNEPETIIERAMKSLGPKNNWGLAPHAPFTASASLYRGCSLMAESEKRPLTTHVAESREEMQMFRDGRGALYDFLRSIGRDMSDCGKGETPLERFLAVTAGRAPAELSPWLIAHLNELTDSDFELLARLTPKFHIVHCPRSHRYFGHRAFQFERLRRLGFEISLGTDSLASNDDLNLFAEMRAFRDCYPGIEPREIIEMITIGPAQALRSQNLIGKIATGAFADLIAIDISNPRDPYEGIVAYDQPVSWTMVNGTILAAARAS
jgi:cytosine/adenosine deaminase-related metal-dependent hydrolase